MGRIEEAILCQRGMGKAALICYLTAGYPDPALFLDYFQACVDGGADIMEVGIPFSDPVADGPVIQETSRKALEKGATPPKVFEMVKMARYASDVPIVLMGYYNPIYRMGEERFAKLAAEAGVHGLIVADLSLEESEGLREALQRRSLDLIQLIAPTTPPHRMKIIARRSSGYIYLMAALGTTGTRDKLDRDLPEVIRHAKAAVGELPLAIGFGVSDKVQVREIVEHGADAVIVGSSILSRIMKGNDPSSIERFVSELKSGCTLPKV